MNPPGKRSARIKEVFITGADGMLGTELVKHVRRTEGYKVIPSTIKDLDITDLTAVRDALFKQRPDIVIHTAAYTQVDSAEKDPLSAMLVNAEGTKNLAFFCRELDIEMIYISSDYVFDGKKGEPYTESDTPCPINTYGRSKWLGEVYIQTLLDHYKIVRTSWLNGLGGSFTRNFIETILRIAQRKNRLSVVEDQIGRPTFTFDVARRLVLMLEVRENGIFHITNSGECSWYELAEEILTMANIEGVTVHPITTAQFRSLALRPEYSVLENRRCEDMGFDPLPHWRESLREYFRRRRLREKAMQTPFPGPESEILPAAPPLSSERSAPRSSG